MTKYPEIDYIKWDANAPIMDHGSQYLTADNQSHLYIEYHRGLARALDRIDNSPLAFEGRSFTGRYLMDNGLEMPLEHDVDYHKRRDYASRVLRLQAR